jgi:drug/metabolite transporter (DMT)-like permease
LNKKSASNFLPVGHAAFYGAGLAVLAAFLFSCLNVSIRYSDPYLTIWHMMFGRSLFGTVFLFLLAKSTGVRLAGKKRKTLVLLGISGTASILCLTFAIIRIAMFEALVLFYTYPVVAAIISPWLTSDRNSLKSWACIAAAFAGTALALWSGQYQAHGLDIGHLAGLGASAGMGLTLTLVRGVSSVNSPLTPIFYVSVVGLLASFVPLFHPDVGFEVAPAGLAWVFVIGLFAVLAHIVTNKALGYIASPKVGSISMLEVVFGAVYGYFLFSEPLGWSTLLGGTLIIAATLGLIRSPAQMPGSG